MSEFETFDLELKIEFVNDDLRKIRSQGRYDYNHIVFFSVYVIFATPLILLTFILPFKVQYIN